MNNEEEQEENSTINQPSEDTEEKEEEEQEDWKLKETEIKAKNRPSCCFRVRLVCLSLDRKGR